VGTAGPTLPVPRLDSPATLLFRAARGRRSRIRREQRRKTLWATPQPADLVSCARRSPGRWPGKTVLGDQKVVTTGPGAAMSAVEERRAQRSRNATCCRTGEGRIRRGRGVVDVAALHARLDGRPPPEGAAAVDRYLAEHREERERWSDYAAQRR